MQKSRFLSLTNPFGSLLLGLVLGFGPPANSVAASEGSTDTKGTPVVLVEDGKAPVPIVLPKGATMFTRMAAEDLANIIEKMSGSRPELIEGAPNPLPKSAIWIGVQPEVKSLFPNLNFEFQHPEEILIGTNGNHLVLAGRDRWLPDKMSAPKTAFTFGNRDVEGFQFEYGTVNAIYTFLHDQLGVRWLWPGADGTVIPSNSTIAVGPIDYRYHPKVRQRSSVFAMLSIYKLAGNPKVESGAWARRQRTQLDSLYVSAGGHGFGNWFLDLADKDPELFALQADGSRDVFPKRQNFKICESNPKAWEAWLNNVEAEIKANPFQTAFSASANDGYASGHCTCNACRAWDHPDAEKRLFHWKSGKEMRPALSDRQVTFANTLARMLKKRYPENDYKVSLLAYGFSRPVPVKAVPDDNVIIVGVANTFSDPNQVDANSPVGTTMGQQMEGWQKIAKSYFWRPNIGNPAGWKVGGPPNTTVMGENFKKAVMSSCDGIHLDQVYYYWATQAPLYYVMAQLAWNPNLEVSAILNEFYESGFGPAAPEVREYWTLLEGAHQEIVKADENWAAGFTPELLAKAGSLLEQAANKTKGTEFAERVEFVKAGFHYLQLRTENLALMAAVRASGKTDSPEREKARQNWAKIEEIVKNHPAALAASYIKNRPEEGLLTGMHPDGKADIRKVRPAPTVVNDLDLN